MTTHSHSPEVQRGAKRWLYRELFGIVFIAALLLFTAGRWRWEWGWAVVGLYAAWVAANALLLMPRDPALLAERAKRQLSDRTWDRVILSLFGVSTLAKYIVAGLDERYNWSPPLALWISVAALGIAAFGYGLVTWSMMANAYFATVSRIQTERRQHVVTTGPYRFVRHPGYIGSILFDLATPLALGSLWALVLGLISVLLMVIRTALEDQMLQKELEGYRAYSNQTRYRLVPWLW